MLKCVSVSSLPPPSSSLPPRDFTVSEVLLKMSKVDVSELAGGGGGEVGHRKSLASVLVIALSDKRYMHSRSGAASFRELPKLSVSSQPDRRAARVIDQSRLSKLD